jgi:hypothetical protein
LRPLCTDEFRATFLPATGPDLVSASTVTGQPVVVRINGRSAEVTIALDTMVLALKLQDVTGSGWLVSDIQPVR